MFLQVRDAKGPIALPTPAQEAIEALANLRAHRLQTDQDMADEMRAEQAKQRKLLRRSTFKAVGLGVGFLLACTLTALLMSPPTQAVQFFGILGSFGLAMSMMLGVISALFARRPPQTTCRELEVALVALAQKDWLCSRCVLVLQ